MVNILKSNIKITVFLISLNCIDLQYQTLFRLTQFPSGRLPIIYKGICKSFTYCLSFQIPFF